MPSRGRFSRKTRRPWASWRRLATLTQALRRTASESKQRLHEIVTRVLRLTELESAEVQAANVNDLLAEVTGVLEPADRERVDCGWSRYRRWSAARSN